MFSKLLFSFSDPKVQNLPNKTYFQITQYSENIFFCEPFQNFGNFFTQSHNSSFPILKYEIQVTVREKANLRETFLSNVIMRVSNLVMYMIRLFMAHDDPIPLVFQHASTSCLIELLDHAQTYSKDLVQKDPDYMLCHDCEIAFETLNQCNTCKSDICNSTWCEGFKKEKGKCRKCQQ